MQAQTTKKERTTKTRNARGTQVVDVDIARLVPPTTDALREAHVNLVRAEQNLFTLMQANPTGSALLGAPSGFGHSAAHAIPPGYDAPGFDGGFARPAAFQGFPGIGNAMVPSHGAVGANPAATVSPWNAWASALPNAPFTAPSASWASRAIAPVSQGQGSSIGRVLACDIIDEGEQLICQLELPGIEADQVEVLCFGSALTVSAYREPEGEILNLVQSERATSPQQRIIRLPSQIQPSGATAALTNGVLTIVLPKLNPTEGPRLVKIQS